MARPIKSTVCYRSINHGRLYFAYTRDPIHHKSQLQSKKHTYLQVVEAYKGRLLPGLQVRFAHALVDFDGSFQARPELLEHLASLPKARFISQTHKQPRRVSHQLLGVLVSALNLNDLPDMARVCDVSRVLGVALATVTAWRREGLRTHRVGQNVKIQREELRAWLVNSNRLMT